MFHRNVSLALTRLAQMVLFCSLAASLPAQAAGNCQNPAITWTIYQSYVDPATSLTMQSAVTGDGLQLDTAGNTVYSSSSGKVSVSAWMNVCSSRPTYDAILNIFKGRSFSVSLVNQLGNVYGKFPPTYSFLNETGLLNVSDIRWCQNHGFPNGCTFYTRLTSAFTGPDGITYHLRTETANSVPVSSWLPDATANCPYDTSPVQVVFTPGSLSPSGKDTYVVTPVLEGTNTGTGWTAPPLAAGCPADSLPAGNWPAAVSVLIQDTTGNSYNFGQYNVPFKFVIQNQ